MSPSPSETELSLHMRSPLAGGDVGGHLGAVCQWDVSRTLARLLKQARMFDSRVIWAGGRNYYLSRIHSGTGAVFSTTRSAF